MTRLTRFLFAAAVLSAGAVAAAIHPQWTRAAKIEILFVLLAALVGAGIVAFRSRRHERHSAAKHLSPSLATLSSAAILAVYAAGYHRTSTAAGGFSEQPNRRKPPLLGASISISAPLAQHAIEPASDGSHAPTLAMQPAKPQEKDHPAKNAHARTTDIAQPAAEVLREYATAAPVAPKAPTSDEANAPAPAAAPQIVMNAPDPSAQLAAPSAPAPPQQALYKDGTYSGWGSCRHGDIQASVTIQEGKIASVAITQCLTRYSCSWIAALPGQVVKRQSPEVDYVSGASQSTDAFYGAVVSALSLARN
jgi:uncharacterized protein with FMN-binding domain